MRAAEGKLFLEIKALHTHKKGKRKGNKSQENPDKHESTKRIRAQRASSKATRLFLWK